VAPAGQAAAVVDLFGSWDDLVGRLLPSHPPFACRVLQATLLPGVPPAQRAMARGLFDHFWVRLANLPGTAATSQRQARLDQLLERACATFNEGGHCIDAYAVRAMVAPIVNQLFGGGTLQRRDEENLRIGMGAASFRNYLALRLLEQLR